jgi:hypothetical protein
MHEPNWSQVLTTLYQSEQSFELQSIDNVRSTHPLVKRTNLEADEVRKSLRFLSNQGLVELSRTSIATPPPEPGEEVEHVDYYIVRLAPEGFSVAHDREIGLRQSASNRAVALLTGILGLTALVQAVIAYVSNNLSLLEILSIGFILLLTAGALVVVWAQLAGAGLMDTDSI